MSLKDWLKAGTKRPAEVIIKESNDTNEADNNDAAASTNVNTDVSDDKTNLSNHVNDKLKIESSTGRSGPTPAKQKKENGALSGKSNING
jgi:hypothetical protein